MVEYPIMEEKILTGEPKECPEYKVTRQPSSAEKKLAQSKQSAMRRKSPRNT